MVDFYMIIKIIFGIFIKLLKAVKNLLYYFEESHTSQY